MGVTDCADYDSVDFFYFLVAALELSLAKGISTRTAHAEQASKPLSLHQIFIHQC
ncbi:MAG: hypothetical protein IT392_03770 [Nitrospirae bacterium]|nr:hypothetical protein [Nitrospirota bacterium]